MAEIPYTRRKKHGAEVIAYETVGAGDTLKPYEPPTGYDLESIQATGTFSGESVMVTGSNDEGSTFNDLLSSAISAAGFGSPTNQAEQYSGAMSGTGGGGDVDVHLLFRAP